MAKHRTKIGLTDNQWEKVFKIAEEKKISASRVIQEVIENESGNIIYKTITLKDEHLGHIRNIGAMI